MTTPQHEAEMRYLREGNTMDEQHTPPGTIAGNIARSAPTSPSTAALQGTEVPRDERPYWTAARELDQAIEHLDLTAGELIDRLQPFMASAALPESPNATPHDTSPAPAVSRMEQAARAVRAIDGRLGTLVNGLLQL